jgi:L-alanine-DL-glutamate epimerase-like enolase superfamily enzyme
VTGTVQTVTGPIPTTELGVTLVQHELVRDPIEQHDGWVSPPDGPGLGVEVDEAVVREYLFD